MRLFIVSAALLFSLSTTAVAQSRWTVSAGPEFMRWDPRVHMWGMRVRAEYDLTKPASVFGLRLEGGVLWSHPQSWHVESGAPRQGGVDQTTDIMLGLSGAITPFPKARVSPYISLGVFGRQVWRHGSFFIHDPTLPSYESSYLRSSRGVMATLGLGLRVRLAGRSFQLELRAIQDHSDLTLGTRLPF